MWSALTLLASEGAELVSTTLPVVEETTAAPIIVDTATPWEVTQNRTLQYYESLQDEVNLGQYLGDEDLNYVYNSVEASEMPADYMEFFEGIYNEVKIEEPEIVPEDVQIPNPEDNVDAAVNNNEPIFDEKMHAKNNNNYMDYDNQEYKEFIDNLAQNKDEALEAGGGEGGGGGGAVAEEENPGAGAMEDEVEADDLQQEILENVGGDAEGDVGGDDVVNEGGEENDMKIDEEEQEAKGNEEGEEDDMEIEDDTEFWKDVLLSREELENFIYKRGQKYRAIFDSIVNLAKKGWNKFVEAVRPYVDKLVAMIKKGAQKVKDAWNYVKETAYKLYKIYAAVNQLSWKQIIILLFVVNFGFDWLKSKLGIN